MDPHLKDLLGCQCHQTSETTVHVATSNKKLVGWRPSLLGWRPLLVVTNYFTKIVSSFFNGFPKHEFGSQLSGLGRELGKSHVWKRSVDIGLGGGGFCSDKTHLVVLKRFSVIPGRAAQAFSFSRGYLTLHGCGG